MPRRVRPRSAARARPSGPTQRARPERCSGVGRVAGGPAAAGIPHLYERTDSQLRGDVGAGLEAVMTAVGARRRAFIPAYPKTGRTTRAGRQYVNGVPLEESSFGRDPLEPADESYVPAILKRQTELPVTVLSPRDDGAGKAVESIEGGIIVFDGEIDDEGFLRITDRKKNLLITAGGKNIAPSNIELLINREPIISQVLVIGDKRKFLSALITISTEELEVLRQGPEFSGLSLEELIEGELIAERVRSAVDRANEELARYENIRRYKVLPREFTIEDSEMTPTMKLKRKVIEQNYADVIEAFSEEPVA